MSQKRSLSSLARQIEAMQEKLEAGKTHMASVLGGEIVKIHSGLLLELGDSELRTLAKYLDVEKAVRAMQVDMKDKCKPKEAAPAESGHNSV